MVNLSIDPPPSPFSPAGRALPRWVLPVVLLLVGAAAGFVAGRKTARRDLGLSATSQAGSRASGGAAAGPGERAPAAGAKEPGAPGAPGSLAVDGLRPAPTAAPVPAAGGGASGLAVPAAGTASAPGPAASPSQGPLLRSIAVTLRGPLEESVAAALAPADRVWASQLTQVVNRILVWSLQIAREGRKGDRLEVVFELPTPQPSAVTPAGDSGPATREPVVLALRYGSQKLGRLVTAYRFKPEGSTFAHYYDAAGVDVEQHLVDSPVSDYEQITSLLRDGRRHKGVDFKTPVGTAVRAPFDGEVTRRNWHFSANGNCLELRDPRSGRKAIFLHLEAAPKEMKPGRKVVKGEVIARSGNSGHSTAPHLHYQLEASDGRVLDPFAVLPVRTVRLEGAVKTAFDRERQRLEPLLVAGR